MAATGVSLSLSELGRMLFCDQPTKYTLAQYLELAMGEVYESITSDAAAIPNMRSVNEDPRG